MDAALATLDIATLQSYRDEALAALHRLAVGQRTESIAYKGNSRSFVPGDEPILRRWIADLQAAIDAKSAGTTLVRGPIHPGLRF
jgi:hypothetical protein